MTDIVNQKVRSRMMSGIQGKDTRPEMIIRSGLHRRGYRFLLHYQKLPGKPDLVLPKHDALILVNGCFWHGHGCQLFKWPKSNRAFWYKKIHNTILRDDANAQVYKQHGWRVMTVWECALKGKDALPEQEERPNNGDTHHSNAPTSGS